tara:strand:+ start:198 stop:2012 length:1815 start_codon:yes stop_codon:yes gene_type:complete
MAETLISPGVLARENDSSFVTARPVERGAAIIGPTVKGPIEQPTLVSSYSSFQAIFGDKLQSGSNEFSYLTSVAANNYFQNGGNSLLVTRVVSGSTTQDWTPATSSAAAEQTGTVAAFGIPTGSQGPTSGLSPFVLETISEGAIMNSAIQQSESDNNVVNGNGALISGSFDNLRYEIASVNSASGVFSLLIRRGDDTNNQKVILEQYNNISLDPLAANFISRAIGDVSTTLVTEGSDTFLQESGSFPNISNLVRVKTVNYATPNYFNNDGTAKDEFTGSLPAVCSGSFGGGNGLNVPTDQPANRVPANFYQNINSTNTQGLLGSDYTNAIALLANQDDYQYNVISAPGLTNQSYATQITSISNNTIARGDAIFVMDLVDYNQPINTVTAQASGLDTSYAAAYWPWVQTVDPNTAQLVYVPASTMIPGVYAFTDASSDPWFAPAGITRGGLGQVVRAERKLTSTNRDTLYEGNVNPIATFPQTGVVVFGQKTLQKAATALDRVNVRRLLIALKDFISQIADNLVFEQNTIATRQNFLTQVNPYLESVQQRQGLFAFKVVMDESNNTPDVIDRNELIGQIFLQPTKTAEFIILDFNVLPTGATFPA